ncbi:MAG: hypothetical protein IPK82_01495 [Polyangiaceae bacterium]|nr:hypothetical protein [Polyangiaceae bacterium]
MRNAIFGLLAAVALVGCGNSGGGDKSAGSGAPGSDKAGGGDGLVAVELNPLPLKIKVPPGGLGAMDMSMGEAKSVTVDIGGGASLNISEADKDFAAVKKQYQGDTILFPFKKWAKEGADLAILEFSNEGKTGYIGFVQKTVGGKKYLCKTTGLDGVPSADVAEKNLKTCDSLAAK